MAFHHSEKGDDAASDALFAMSEEAIRQRIAPTATNDVLVFMQNFYRMSERSSTT